MRPRNLLVLSLLAALVFPAAPRARAEDSPPSAARPALRPDRLISYAETARGPLRLHVFLPPVAPKSPALRPAVLFFFGGGWRKGSAGQFFPQAKLLADKGLVAIAADYRTSGSHGTTPQDAVADAVAAMHWLRTHAAELGVDPDRIVASGGSAGGHLAACLAFADAGKDPADPAARPAALVLFNPVLDLSNKWEDVAGVDWRRISPRHHLSAAWPPTLILVGSADTTTPIEIARQTVSELQAAGVDATLREYAGQQHGFFNYQAARPENFDRTMAAMVEFLSAHGFLPPAAAAAE